jgi:hypothetical protein
VAANVSATDDYAEAGPQDLVILALKAHQVAAVADQLPLLLGPDTAWSPCRTAYRTGISTAMAARTKAGRCSAAWMPMAGWRRVFRRRA